jgi:hypothetical protein
MRLRISSLRRLSSGDTTAKSESSSDNLRKSKALPFTCMAHSWCCFLSAGFYQTVRRCAQLRRAAAQARARASFQ